MLTLSFYQDILISNKSLISEVAGPTVINWIAFTLLKDSFTPREEAKMLHLRVDAEKSNPRNYFIRKIELSNGFSASKEITTSGNFIYLNTIY